MFAATVRAGQLREGTIENALIYYERENQAEPKQSNVIVTQTRPDSTLKALLSHALGILVVVEKQREIYFIDNVKFHIDAVNGLGHFIEIEAIGQDRRLVEKRTGLTRCAAPGRQKRRCDRVLA